MRRTLLPAVGLGAMVLLSARPVLARQADSSSKPWLEAENNRQIWFAGGYVPRYLKVRLRGATAADCEQHAVRFDAFSGGEASPDSALARWRVGENGAPGWCEAETRWKLSDAIGLQKLQARIVGAAPVASADTVHTPVRVFEAVSRARPRVTIGIAVSHINNRYDTLAVTGVDTTVVAFRERSGVIPVFGVETPIVMPWARTCRSSGEYSKSFESSWRRRSSTPGMTSSSGLRPSRSPLGSSGKSWRSSSG